MRTRPSPDRARLLECALQLPRDSDGPRNAFSSPKASARAASAAAIIADGRVRIGGASCTDPRRRFPAAFTARFRSRWRALAVSREGVSGAEQARGLRVLARSAASSERVSSAAAAIRRRAACSASAGSIRTRPACCSSPTTARSSTRSRRRNARCRRSISRRRVIRSTMRNSPRCATACCCTASRNRAPRSRRMRRDERLLELTVLEGKYHQVKRMVAAAGQSRGETASRAHRRIRAACDARRRRMVLARRGGTRGAAAGKVLLFGA